MKKSAFLIALCLVLGYGAADIQKASAVKPDIGTGGTTYFSINPLTAEGETGYRVNGQINKNTNTGLVTVLLEHTNDVNYQVCNVTMTPSEFEAYRLFVARGF